jgi:hypothetical protein
VDEVALWQVSPQAFGFPLLVIISPLLCTDLLLPHEGYDSHDQTAYYHTLGPK